MELRKKAQISIEYLVVVGFVTFLVISILGIGYFYSSSANDRIRFNQVSTFSNKLISSAESVFYAGEPSKLTLTAYLPSGIRSVQVLDKDLVFNILTSTGVTNISFSSTVSLQGSISPSQGVKRLQLTAEQNHVLITEG